MTTQPARVARAPAHAAMLKVLRRERLEALEGAAGKAGVAWLVSGRIGVVVISAIVPGHRRLAEERQLENASRRVTISGRGTSDDALPARGCFPWRGPPGPWRIDAARRTSSSQETQESRRAFHGPGGDLEVRATGNIPASPPHDPVTVPFNGTVTVPSANLVSAAER